MNDRIPHIFYNTIYAKKLFEIVNKKHLKIREMWQQLSTFNDLEKCSGALLDVFGNNIKIARLDMDDEEYRRVIKFELSLLTFIGTIEEVKAIIGNYYGLNSDNFNLVELSAKIIVIVPDFLNKEDVLKKLKRIKTAGVGLQVDFEVYLEDYTYLEVESMTYKFIEKLKYARG